MRKKVTALMLLATCVTIGFFAGCSTSLSNETDISSKDVSTNFNFETVYTDDNLRIFREKTTDVLYILYNSLEKAGLTIMLDPETGKPLTYSNWQAYYQNK